MTISIEECERQLEEDAKNRDPNGYLYGCDPTEEQPDYDETESK